MSASQVVIIGAIVFLSMTLECIAGFGATILAMPFLTMLLGINQAAALMSMVSGLTGIYIFIINHSYINGQVLRQILLFCGLGLPFGMIGVNVLPQRASKIILGIFVTFSALKSIVHAIKATKTPQKAFVAAENTGIIDKVLLFLGGVIHGAFACGGPLMTVYAAKTMKNKDEFRATMTSVWVITATILLVKNVLFGNVITGGFLLLYAKMLPFLAVSILLGSWLHKVVSEEIFAWLINILLLIAGGITLAMQLL